MNPTLSATAQAGLSTASALGFANGRVTQQCRLPALGHLAVPLEAGGHAGSPQACARGAGTPRSRPRREGPHATATAAGVATRGHRRRGGQGRGDDDSRAVMLSCGHERVSCSLCLPHARQWGSSMQGSIVCLACAVCTYCEPRFVSRGHWALFDVSTEGIRHYRTPMPRRPYGC